MSSVYLFYPMAYYPCVYYYQCGSLIILGVVGGNDTGMTHVNASFSLLLPGKVLYFNAKRRFRDRGNKTGAKLAWNELDNSGLGAFIEKPANEELEM